MEKSVLKTKWEVRARRRLVQILNFSDLVQLNKTTHAKENNSENRSSLAQDLILRHGRDLLSKKEIRDIISKRYEIEDYNPNRWVSGSYKAKEFTELIEFPEEFAGEKEGLNLENYNFLKTPIVRKLEDFQTEIVEEMYSNLKSDEGSRFIISLPTGSGKTTTCIRGILNHIMSLDKDKPRNIIWFAHTKELCNQAYNTFTSELDARKDNKDGVYLFRCWDRYRDKNIDNIESLEDEATSIMVWTPQMFHTSINENSELKDFLTKKTSIVVIDEAHRSGSKTYKEIIRDLSDENNSISFIGLTATPYRKEYMSNSLEDGTKSLKELFGKLLIPSKTLGSNPKKELQKRGYLSLPKTVNIDIKTPIRLDENNNQGLSERIIDKDLQKKADNQKRRESILEFIKKQNFKPDSKILYFSPSARDAQEFSLMLRKAGYSSGCITGETNSKTRRRIIDDFSSGKIQFVCNCEILTTGFDEPKIDHVIMARPTISQVLYEQMIGRGLRGEKFGGTKTCTFFVCTDVELQEGKKLYQLWDTFSEEHDVKAWDFNTLFKRSLIFMAYKDQKLKRVEIEKFRELCSQSIKEDHCNESLATEFAYVFDWIDEYYEQLRIVSPGLTDEQRILLLNGCKEISMCDGHVDQKEIEFIKELISNGRGDNSISSEAV